MSLLARRKWQNDADRVKGRRQRRGRGKGLGSHEMGLAVFAGSQQQLSCPFIMLCFDVTADKRHGGRNHGRIICETKARHQIRDHVRRHDKIGKRREKNPAHPRGRFVIHGAVIGRTQIFRKRHTSQHLAQFRKEPVLNDLLVVFKGLFLSQIGMIKAKAGRVLVR